MCVWNFDANVLDYTVLEPEFYISVHRWENLEVFTLINLDKDSI